MSYHGVGANGPTDYEPSYETQPAEPPRYGALQPYPWDAGVPRDWPPQGIVGPSGEYSTAGFRLPRAGMGEDESVSRAMLIRLLGGAVGAAVGYSISTKEDRVKKMILGALFGSMVVDWVMF